MVDVQAHVTDVVFDGDSGVTDHQRGSVYLRQDRATADLPEASGAGKRSGRKSEESPVKIIPAHEADKITARLVQ